MCDHLPLPNNSRVLAFVAKTISSPKFNQQFFTMRSDDLLKFAVAIVCIFVYSVSTIECTLGPNDKKDKIKTQKAIVAKRGPVSQTIRERNLVEQKPLVEGIFENHATFYRKTSVRSFEGPVLAFVTVVSQLMDPAILSMECLTYDIPSLTNSGTTMATTWQKYLVQSSIKCHRFGCKSVVVDQTHINWVVLMTLMLVG